MPARTASAPSTFTASSSSEVPFLIPDPEAVADIRRIHSLPNSVGLGQFVHQYGDCMLPPLTQAELESLQAQMPPLEAATPAPVSSTTASLDIFSSAPNVSYDDPAMGLMQPSPSTASSSPIESSNSSFELQLGDVGVNPAFFTSFLPQQQQYSAPVLSQEQQQLFDMSLMNMDFSGMSAGAFQPEQQPRSLPQQIHHHNPQAYGNDFVPSYNDMTPAEPELYESLLRSQLDAPAQQQQQQLPATSDADSFSLSMSENVDLSSVAGLNVTVGANGQLEWTASTPPFAMPSPFDTLSQSSNSPRAGTPAQSQSRNVSASSSFSYSNTDAGSIGAMRRSHSPAGHAHPYAVNGRLEALARKQKQLAEKRAEMEREEAELQLAMAIEAGGFSDLGMGGGM